MSHFYIPWKHQKTGGIGVEHWLKMCHGSWMGALLYVFSVYYLKGNLHERTSKALQKIKENLQFQNVQSRDGF